MRNAWANAVALRSEKSVGCTIERKALIAIAYRKTALHTTGGRAALHCMGGENMRDVPAGGTPCHERGAAGRRFRCKLGADQRRFPRPDATARLCRGCQPTSGGDHVLSRRP